MASQEVFKALSDPVRREVLIRLKSGKMSVGALGAHFEMTGSPLYFICQFCKKLD